MFMMLLSNVVKIYFSSGYIIVCILKKWKTSNVRILGAHNIPSHLTFQAPAVVAHFARDSPLSGHRFVELFAALVEYFLAHGRPVTLALGFGAAARLQSAAASGAIVFLVRDRHHLSVVRRLSRRLKRNNIVHTWISRKAVGTRRGVLFTRRREIVDPANVCRAIQVTTMPAR